MTWFFQQGHSRIIKKSSVARSPSMQNKGKQRPVMGNRRESNCWTWRKKNPFLGISVERQARLLTSGSGKIASAQKALTNYGCSTWIQFTLSFRSCLTLGHVSPFFCYFQEVGSCYSLGQCCHQREFTKWLHKNSWTMFICSPRLTKFSIKLHS